MKVLALIGNILNSLVAAFFALGNLVDSADSSVFLPLTFWFVFVILLGWLGYALIVGKSDRTARILLLISGILSVLMLPAAVLLIVASQVGKNRASSKIPLDLRARSLSESGDRSAEGSEVTMPAESKVKSDDWGDY